MNGFLKFHAINANNANNANAHTKCCCQACQACQACCHRISNIQSHCDQSLPSQSLPSQSGPNPSIVANDFIKEYYKNTSIYGWNNVQHIFDHNCVVILGNQNIGNEHDLLNTLSYNYVKRANYDNLQLNWSVISPNIMLINVFGNLQFISFNDCVCDYMKFSESFILVLTSNNTVSCSHHILNL